MNEELAKTIEAAVLLERVRCTAIVQAARAGEIDSDLRSIIHYIQSGKPLNGEKEEAE